MVAGMNVCMSEFELLYVCISMYQCVYVHEHTGWGMCGYE